MPLLYFLYFVALICIGISQLYLGYWGIEYHLGWQWATAAFLTAFFFGWVLPITIGTYFGAVDVMGWEWYFALLLAAPGLLFVVPFSVNAAIEHLVNGISKAPKTQDSTTGQSRTEARLIRNTTVEELNQRMWGTFVVSIIMILVGIYVRMELGVLTVGFVSVIWFLIAWHSIAGRVSSIKYWAGAALIIQAVGALFFIVNSGSDATGGYNPYLPYAENLEQMLGAMGIPFFVFFIVFINAKSKLDKHARHLNSLVPAPNASYNLSENLQYERYVTKNKFKNAASNLFTFMGLALLLLGGLVFWGKSNYTASGPLAEAICLRIDRDTNMRALSQTLEDRGAVSNAVLFRIGVEYQDLTQQIKAGNFLIPKSVSMDQIAKIVTRGGANTCGTEIVYRIGISKTMVQIRELDPATETLVERANFKQGDDAPEIFADVNARSGTRHRIALAEGVTSWQVVQSFSGIEALAGELVDIPEEGSIAPDSYEVRQGESRQSVLNRMMAAQEAILIEAWETRAEGLPLTTPHEALILASIIEKETALTAERDQVASVFINRLNRGIALHTDPSVIYGLTQGKSALGRGLRRSELKKDTPWNTYLYRGLPPTPIANPGRDSIRAALNPADTKFLYFVADGQGGHAFATNLKDHNKNVAKWRAIEAERKKN